MRVLSLLSGGKDSIAAIQVARGWGWDVVGACTLRVIGADSYMFHRPNARWAPMVAEAMGIRSFVGDTEGTKEVELDDLEALLVHARDETGAEAVVSGALASEYQRTRIERIGHKIGLKTFTPVWHKDRRSYLEWLLAARFHIRFVAVGAEGLGRGWLGRPLTPRALEELGHIATNQRIDLAGEGGEYETLVVNGPGFERPVLIGAATPHWTRDSGWWEIEEASLGALQTTVPPIPVE